MRRTFSLVVNTPVDSTTMSTPLAPHGISSGALQYTEANVSMKHFLNPQIMLWLAVIC